MFSIVGEDGGGDIAFVISPFVRAGVCFEIPDENLGVEGSRNGLF